MSLMLMRGGVGDLTGIAAEVVVNRRHSPIGSPQRHYTLAPVMITRDGVCSGVVVIRGIRGTYVYASDRDGNIADYEILLAGAPGGTGSDVVLAAMGYRIGGSSVQGNAG